MAGKKRWGRALVAVLAAAASFGVCPRAGAAAAPTAAPTEEGFRIVDHATYRLDPAGSAVHVEIVTELTNQSPSTRRGNYISSVYLPSYGLPVLAEATNVTAAKDDGSSLSVTMEPVESPRFMIAKVDLSPDLFYPNTQTVRLTYDIPSLPPRSDGISRVNAAYARFPVQTFGDPGLSDVEVYVPKGFDVQMSDDSLTKEDRGTEEAYVARAIADPEGFFTVVSARNDDALVTSEVDTDDVDIDVQAWPGDEAWGEFVADHVERGLPVLKGLIGQPWKGDDRLDIVETGNPYIYGYSGWYLPTKSVIEIGDRLDPTVILHELSHSWFNDDLFAGRWINEALAEEYARETAQRLGGAVDPLVPIDPADPGAQRLNSWGDPVLDESISDAHERYGYNASLTLLHQIREEIGFEGLAKVIDAAFARTLAYRGDHKPEKASGVPDWRRFLDLLDEVGGSTIADGLFETHVVDPGEAAGMALRKASRARYLDLEERGEEWSPPRVIRERLGEWQFAAADTLMEDANKVLDLRDEIEAVLEPIGLPVPEAVEEAYETAPKLISLDEVEDQATELLAAAKELAIADSAVDGSRGPFETLGLLFADPDATLRDAQEALDDGDADLATAKAHAARDTIGDAQTAGLQRAAGGVVVLGAAGAGGVLLRRRRNRPPSTPPTDVHQSDGSVGLVHISRTGESPGDD